jgi:hypothetical protein
MCKHGFLNQYRVHPGFPRATAFYNVKVAHSKQARGHRSNPKTNHFTSISVSESSLQSARSWVSLLDDAFHELQDTSVHHDRFAPNRLCENDHREPDTLEITT